MLNKFLRLLASTSFLFATMAIAQMSTVDECHDYEGTAEQLGVWKGKEFIFQRSDCGGGGHTGYAWRILAKDAKDKKEIDSIDDFTMADGDPIKAIFFKEGRVVFGQKSDAEVYAFNEKENKLKKIFETKRQPDKKRQEMTPDMLMGTSLGDTLRKIAEFRKTDCEEVVRIGRILVTDPDVYERAMVLAAHKEASALYKTGKKKDAAKVVLKLLAQEGSVPFNFFPSHIYDPQDPPAESSTDDSSREWEYIAADIRNARKNYDIGFVRDLQLIPQWNDLAFYLEKGDFPALAEPILEWVTAAVPERKAARKNLSDVRKEKSSRRVSDYIFDQKKYVKDEKNNLKALQAFIDRGGMVDWQYIEFTSPAIDLKFQDFDPKKCQKDTPVTLLDLALAAGHTEVADLLAQNGLVEDSSARTLWNSALQNSSLKSVKWLSEKNIGFNNPEVLQQIVQSDSIEAYKIWAKYSPNAKSLVGKSLDLSMGKKLFDYWFNNGLVSFQFDNLEIPNLIFFMLKNTRNFTDVPGKIRKLVASGVDINTLDSDRETALDIATNQRESELENTLKSLGAKTGKEVLQTGKLPKYQLSDIEASALKVYEDSKAN